MARGLAKSVAGAGITVNRMLPDPITRRCGFFGALATSEGTSLAEVEREFFKKVRPTSLIERLATPEEVASLVAYLANPLASTTTGAALRVDGGVSKSVV